MCFPVAESTVLGCGLSTVALVAERLQVLVGMIAAVSQRYDVVNVGGRDDLSICIAGSTQRFT